MHEIPVMDSHSNITDDPISFLGFEKYSENFPGMTRRVACTVSKIEQTPKLSQDHLPESDQDSHSH
jgi:hypothetical protein